MAVKIADTLKALSNTFPVAECVDIDVNINGTTKRLQKAIDDGEIGGGSDSTWKGTHEEWEALSTEEKGKYEVICFTDDYDESGICESDSTWKGTHEEWEALSTEEKGKYEVVYFTDDYDESGIGGSDSIWKGTRDEWEALLTSEKQKYVIVYFTDDYDGADSTGLIDDTNTSVKTTYSSSKIENSLSKKANTTDLTSHTSDTNTHITTNERTKWNEVDNKVNKTDIVDNLTSTDTNKPLSAKQGKALNDKIDNKANDNEVIKKTAITTTIDASSTDTQVPSAKAIYNKSKNSITNLPNNTDIKSYAETFNNLFITDTVRIRDYTSSPYGVGNKINDFYYTIYNMDEKRYKRIIAYDIRKNDMYMIMRNADGWGTWRRVCATGVSDIEPTTINPTLPSTVTLGSSQRIIYSIKNGWANVSTVMQFASPKLSWTVIATGLPKPDKTVNTSTLGETFVNAGVAYRIKTDGTLEMLIASEITQLNWWNINVSYPVAEN